MHRKILTPERWAAGIDPGFKTTAVVLLADDRPIVAQCARDTSSHRRHYRLHKMGLWLTELLSGWITEYEIKELHVMIELAFLNKTSKSHGVTTMAAQMAMHGVYLDALYRLPTECLVYAGEVHNATAKAVLTGDGKATKTTMVANSVWAKRPDLGQPEDGDFPRQHLADAQAIGTCYPDLFLIDRMKADDPSQPYHVDGAIGHGPKWKGKI